MFVAVLFLPVVAGNVFTENSSKRVPEVTERSGYRKTYTIFDPCNTRKPGGRAVSCSQLLMKGNYESGQYVINPGNENITVYCDMKTDGGGWTVIQRRKKQETPQENLFDKSYEEYENGFGNVMGSFWLGNKHIHTLTTHPHKQQALRIQMNSTTEQKNTTVDYGIFQVGSKEEGYNILFSKHRGAAGVAILVPFFLVRMYLYSYSLSL
ncbi:fibrinogen C domain-containing protein 1-like [Ixodes scapularis]|uniref:fibrinogen C domain-containing protein 1-like n=1 Tax=Ixodes scapularis TaxID=6945 RepID=UPI001A9D1FA0|nr:fibrinogen C domain-containing protein 1-like [Ixodes scapularis]